MDARNPLSQKKPVMGGAQAERGGAQLRVRAFAVWMGRRDRPLRADQHFRGHGVHWGASGRPLVSERDVG